MSTNHAHGSAVELLDATGHYTCQDCGHEWDAPAPCVDCGAPAELVIVYPPRTAGEDALEAPLCVACALDLGDRTLDAVSELYARCRAIMHRQAAQGAPLDNPPANPPITSVSRFPRQDMPRNRAQRRAELRSRTRHKQHHTRTMRGKGRPS